MVVTHRYSPKSTPEIATLGLDKVLELDMDKVGMVGQDARRRPGVRGGRRRPSRREARARDAVECMVDGRDAMELAVECELDVERVVELTVERAASAWIAWRTAMTNSPWTSCRVAVERRGWGGGKRNKVGGREEKVGEGTMRLHLGHRCIFLS
jgi:hypothetical protein